MRLRILLGSTVLLWPRMLAAQSCPLTARDVQALVEQAERAWSEKDSRKDVAIPDEIAHEVMAGSAPEDDHYLKARQFYLESNVVGGLAVEGPGCSATGNCLFRVYHLKGGHYRAVLRTFGVQSFVFLTAKSHGYPDLITWTHESAFESEARLFRFDGQRYKVSGGWEESSRYRGADGNMVDLEKPRLTPFGKEQCEQ
jgi:hypothetical protein